jgi:MFS family permease
MIANTNKQAFSNIFLKKLRPSKYIPGLCLAWGLVTTLTSQVDTWGGLVATRIFLGLTEAPLFPSICFIIAMWYPRSTTCFRFAIFFCSASLAGAFGGLLARGLMTINTPGIEHWRAIYLVEGKTIQLLTVLARLTSSRRYHYNGRCCSCLLAIERRLRFRRVPNCRRQGEASSMACSRPSQRIPSIQLGRSPRCAQAAPHMAQWHPGCRRRL